MANSGLWQNKALKNQVLSALLTDLWRLAESNCGHTDFQSVTVLIIKVNISNNCQAINYGLIKIPCAEGGTRTPIPITRDTALNRACLPISPLRLYSYNLMKL